MAIGKTEGKIESSHSYEEEGEDYLTENSYSLVDKIFKELQEEVNPEGIHEQSCCTTRSN